MAARSSSSATISRTRCAACPSGTNSCTEGGSSHASFTRHGRKLFVMPPSESPPTAEVEPLWPYRDTLLARRAAPPRGERLGEGHGPEVLRVHAGIRLPGQRRPQPPVAVAVQVRPAAAGV